MAGRTSLKDVARAAGVSTSTASRVLAGVDRNVDPQLAARVRDAQSVLGYRVNAAARALRLQSTGTIGLLVPAIANAYFAELVAEYSRQLDAAGSRLVTIDTNESVESEKRQLEGMDRVLVDALLVVPVDHVESAAAINAVARFRPVIQVDRTAESVHAPSVQSDNAAGMRLLVDHLRQRGRRRILFVDAQEHSSSSVERVEAFKRLAGPGDWVMQMSSYSMSSGIEAAHRMLGDDRETDAIICTADVVALGMLTALQHEGIRVPDEFALASFDGTALADIVAPGLTSLASPVQRIVESSLMLLESGSTRNVLLPPELVVRGSTAPELATFTSSGTRPDLAN